MSNATVLEVIAGWSPGHKIPTPVFNNWRDLQVFAQWLAQNEHVPSDLRAKAAEHAAEADRQIAFWTAVADAMTDGEDDA